MSDERRDNPIDESTLSVGAAVRLAADGELSPKREAELPADARERIAFERTLRAAVGRSMTGDRAGAELRSQVAAAMRREAGEAPPAGGVLAVLRRNWSLAAMVLVAIGLGVIYAQRMNAPSPEERRALEFASLMLNDEATRYTEFGDAFERFVPYKGVEEIRTGMREVLGIDLAIRDLSAIDLEPVGLAPCSLPWTGTSGQLIYRDEGSGRWATVIMNVVPPTVGEEDRLEAGVTHRIDPGTGDQPVYVWREGEVVFYYVASSEEHLPKALGLMGAPARVKAFDVSGGLGPAYPSGEAPRG